MNTEETTQSSTSQGKHTPGPWTVVRSDYYDATVLAIDADVYPYRIASSETVRGADLSPAIANANLIAAAPEMLYALQRASYQLTTHDGDRLSLLLQINALIAKAEGRAL